MKFDLSCTLMANKELEEAKQTIDEFISGINRQSTDNFKIMEWSINHTSLYLHLQSMGPVRAHERLLRLKKSLDELLGKRHRLGIRGVHLDVYIIEFDLEDSPQEKINIPFAQVSIEDKHVTLRISDKDEDF